MGYPHFRKPLSPWNEFPWNNLSQLLGYPHDYGNPLHLSKRRPAIWWLWGNIGPPRCDYLMMAGQESPSPYEPWRIHVAILHIYIYTYCLSIYVYIYIVCVCIHIYICVSSNIQPSQSGPKVVQQIIIGWDMAKAERLLCTRRIGQSTKHWYHC